MYPTFRAGNNSAGQAYGVKAIPQNILVDPEGKVVARKLTRWKT
ncbi:TlpA family protein disulfide reductase [Sphingobacterium daejeonense]|nr:hypothetical protein [Sphingobacterium daejeonense]VTP86586.1 Uncharacterised protein [Sphingobacterium daejeonense]